MNTVFAPYCTIPNVDGCYPNYGIRANWLRRGLPVLEWLEVLATVVCGPRWPWVSVEKFLCDRRSSTRAGATSTFAQSQQLRMHSTVAANSLILLLPSATGTRRWNGTSGGADKLPVELQGATAWLIAERKGQARRGSRLSPPSHIDRGEVEGHELGAATPVLSGRPVGPLRQRRAMSNWRTRKLLDGPSSGKESVPQWAQLGLAAQAGFSSLFLFYLNFFLGFKFNTWIQIRFESCP
jgi:hypothetical protein